VHSVLAKRKMSTCIYRKEKAEKRVTCCGSWKMVSLPDLGVIKDVSISISLYLSLYLYISIYLYIYLYLYLYA